MANILKEYKLIVWDECSISHKKVLEAWKNCLKDLKNSNSIIGRVTVLLTGDFWDVLLVITRRTLSNEVTACIKSWYMYPQIKNSLLQKM